MKKDKAKGKSFSAFAIVIGGNNNLTGKWTLNFELNNFSNQMIQKFDFKYIYIIEYLYIN